MLSLDQGNPALKSNDPGQTWLLSAWKINKYKSDMSPDVFWSHMNQLCKNYDPDAADAAYESYVEGEDVEVTKTSSLLAQSTFTNESKDGMRQQENESSKRVLCGYTSAHQVHQHARMMGSICLITGTPYKEGVMEFYLDRKLDDLHHRPDDYLLIGTHLIMQKCVLYSGLSPKG